MMTFCLLYADAGLSLRRLSLRSGLRDCEHQTRTQWPTRPPVKLVDFFASKYEKDSFGPSKTFATEVARSFSPALAKVPGLSEEHVAKFVRYLNGKAWKSSSILQGVDKTFIVIMGSPGTGKSMIGNEMAQVLDIPFIEGDELHARQDIAKIRLGMTLSDEQSLFWIDRIN